MNTADTKAEAARLFDGLTRGLGEIAVARRQLRDDHPDIPLPEDIKQQIIKTRQILRRAGLPQRVIDTTPGLEPLDWMGR